MRLRRRFARDQSGPDGPRPRENLDDLAFGEAAGRLPLRPCHAQLGDQCLAVGDATAEPSALPNAAGRALIGDPSLMLPEEPSEGIRPSVVGDVCDRLRAIRDELGATTLFVERNLDTIHATGERAYVMEKAAPRPRSTAKACGTRTSSGST